MDANYDAEYQPNEGWQYKRTAEWKSMLFCNYLFETIVSGPHSSGYPLSTSARTVALTDPCIVPSTWKLWVTVLFSDKQ